MVQLQSNSIFEKEHTCTCIVWETFNEWYRIVVEFIILPAVRIGISLHLKRAPSGRDPRLRG